MLGDGVVFVQPGNAKSLANAIESLVANPSILTKKQRRALEVSQRFTSENITKELAQWVKDHALT